PLGGRQHVQSPRRDPDSGPSSSKSLGIRAWSTSLLIQAKKFSGSGDLCACGGDICELAELFRAEFISDTYEAFKDRSGGVTLVIKRSRCGWRNAWRRKNMSN
ncbi:unnamed protein product, partial [Ascophyllum nodosum]